MLPPQYYYNLIQSVAYFIAAIVPVYFVLKSRKNNDRKSFENISILFVGFILIQGVYHLFGVFGFKLLAKGFLEPLSIVVLLLFGLTYLRYTKNERKSYKFN
jgi:hypothetical protein